MLIPAWIFLGVPYVEVATKEFNYTASIVSVDNFFNENLKKFEEGIYSKTQFFYQFVSQEKGVYLIKNVFDVKTPEDKPIFSVERLYGINPKTGMHVLNYGDRDRTGYLFAPRNLRKQDYVYWHINYDAPATMHFQNEEIIYGLKTYRYASKYMVDQTANLGHLPGVPDKRGINNDVELQVWIEPTSGRLIKYQDNTIAYYYDIKTHDRLHPWNKFTNHYQEQSVRDQVKQAKLEKLKFLSLEWIIPVSLGILGLVCVGKAYVDRST